MCVSSSAWGQSPKTDIADVKKYLDFIRNSKGYAYQYSISAKYPNGQTDKVKGEVFADDSRKFMFNSCDAFTMIYTGKWYYKADHQSQEIAVIDLDKQYNKKYKSQLEESVFNNNGVNIFIDSFLLKRTSGIKKTQHRDTTNIEISFPKEVLVRSIKITFNEKKNEIISYAMTTYQPWPTDEFGKNKGTLTEVEYRNEVVKDPGVYNSEKYFVVENGKVLLKKNSTYKLSTKL